MSQASEKFIRLSQLHRLKRCEQVAAVCYRIGGRGVEFLLVQTRGGRWTFPKGSTEPGLTHAQAAAIEAFEEAGVHGRIEEASFGRYAYGGRYIHAHLCEVLRLDPPQEFGRNPTWFSAGTAKRRLRDGRKADEAAEICGVVDRAIMRIERQRNATLRELQVDRKDPLQMVCFEAGAERTLRSDMRRVAPAASGTGPPVLRVARVLQLTAPREFDENLGSGKIRR